MQKQLFTAFLLFPLLLLSSCSSEEMVQQEGSQVKEAAVQSGNIANQKKDTPQQNTPSPKYDKAVTAPADKTQNPTAKEDNVTVTSKQPAQSSIGSKQLQEFKNTTNQHPTNTKSSANEQKQTNAALTYDQVKSTLHKGMSKEEVEAFLKVTGVKIVSALDGKTMYRYDIAFPDHYQFTATLAEDGTQLDDVDIDGVKKYKGVIVFVEYDEQATIKGYSIFYVDEKTQKVHAYYHYPTFEKTDILE
ncbi:hypothetical protein IC801_15980 [Geobacillus sp. 44B]|uniref:Lipoprotein n=1 Tax=Saccharococcus caldoxylosilyticus TaxID=81408 RepID=A0A150LDB2_9BACL|nr:hypothetical protein [Parageobacillus caldoxylosilyticus]KYD09956.1 hypothetical protein B4119_4265 [Parageobacillus caldoxylosilyticus]OQO95874.1 hypothetical protein BSK33_18220 [Geobacillus sp. 44B]QNU37254.1 hypothetical protein IC801_15980 [Geobacillus sp. 44B]QXJ40557.1 hypothetical protein BV455_03931 [Parageobacillus caldoxylosilyticus]